MGRKRHVRRVVIAGVVLPLAVISCKKKDTAPPEPAATVEPAPPAEPESPEAPAIIATVQSVFDAMTTRDVTVLKKNMAPDARLAAVSESEGEPVRVTKGEDFIKAVSGGTGDWKERMWNPKVRVDGNVATLWAEYDFWLDGERTHCGTDAVQLVRAGDGWQIVSITYSKRTEGCTEPSGPVVGSGG